MPAANEVKVECSYCWSRIITLTGDDAAEWLEANEEHKPSHLCSHCVATCRAHARLARAEQEWIADGSPQ